MRVLWDPWDSDVFHYEWDRTSPLHVFHWASWQWRQYLGESPVMAYTSPPEWEEFWAGVLDVLLTNTEGSLGQDLPLDTIVPWRQVCPGVVQIGLIRTTQPTNNAPPAWYDNRQTRWERLMGNDLF